MGQHTYGGGSLCAYPKSKRRAMLAQAVLECEGVLRHTAHALGYHRSHMYRLIDEYRLWPVVNKIRKRRIAREARERRRRK